MRRTCVPTSTETPIERGSVTRCDGQGVDRGNGSGSRASPSGGAGTALPRVRGPLDPADRRPARSLAGDGQGVLLRPDRREGEGGQGPLPGRVSRLRRLHAAAQRQGRRLRVLQGLPPRRDRAAVDAQRVLEAMREWRAPVRPAAVVVRLVAHARPAPRRCSVRAAETRATGRPRASSRPSTEAGLTRVRPRHGAATGEPAEVGGDAVPGRPDAAPSSPADPGSQQGIVRALPSTSTT